MEAANTTVPPARWPVGRSSQLWCYYLEIEWHQDIAHSSPNRGQLRHHHLRHRPRLGQFRSEHSVKDTRRLTVLGRSHSSRIYVHIWIYFNSSDLQACHLQEKARRRCYFALFQTWGLRWWGCMRIPMTPFPMPLTTPPETRMNFVMMDREAGTKCGWWTQIRVAKENLVSKPPVSPNGDKIIIRKL